MKKIGIDTGGTFTDFVSVEVEGLRVHKLRSTPDDPARAILQGIADLWGASGGDVIHGSTVATNAVLERRGARTALVTTAGFEDVPAIGRQTRKELYNFQVDPRPRLVDPDLTFGVVERLAADGSVLVPLDESDLDRIVVALHDRRVEAVAVCLLHAYRNPAHEERIVERLAGEGFAVTASHRVLREYREFERFSTTIVNAYVMPVMARYLTNLESHLSSGAGTLSIMQSNGGTIPARTAREMPVRTILSGPAGGAVGARETARLAGFTRVITFDMGGTSTDVALIDGAIAETTESVVGDFPVKLAMLDIHTVGAGGGSVAYLDSGGALRVGPRSAGADPGPMCYGKGGELTVTDANVLLGRIDPDHFWGGKLKLDIDRTAREAERFAKQIGLTARKLAEGIVEIANANMEAAIRVVSVQRGHDPREFALVAFGGAGGLHACEVAARLDIPTVVIPRHAGVLSALGMVLADARKDLSKTVLLRADAVSNADLAALFAPLAADCGAVVAAEPGVARTTVARELDLRYVGQGYEIAVPFGDDTDFVADFHAAHARLYGYANPNRHIEIVNVRVKGVGFVEKPELPRAEAVPHAPEPKAVRPVFFHGRKFQTNLFLQSELKSGATGVGPAIVAGDEATAVIPPRHEFSVDGYGNIIIRLAG